MVAPFEQWRDKLQRHFFADRVQQVVISRAERIHRMVTVWVPSQTRKRACIWRRDCRYRENAMSILPRSRSNARNQRMFHARPYFLARARVISRVFSQSLAQQQTCSAAHRRGAQMRSKTLAVRMPALSPIRRNIIGLADRRRKCHQRHVQRPKSVQQIAVRALMKIRLNVAQRMCVQLSSSFRLVSLLRERDVRANPRTHHQEHHPRRVFEPPVHRSSVTVYQPSQSNLQSLFVLFPIFGPSFQSRCFQSASLSMFSRASP
jgi:hypothetical protein